MRPTNMTKALLKTQLLLLVLVAVALSLTATAYAAAPGITGTTFNLTAQTAYLNQPDGETVYSWGYGCVSQTGVSFAPAAITTGTCPTMQVPGPTLVFTEGQTITVNLTNSLPSPVGNTSILFPGLQLVSAAAAATQPLSCTQTTAATRAPQGLLTVEAANGCTVTYTLKATSPGTRAYYSGTQGDLQVEMGLYGAVIVLPSTPPANCAAGLHAGNLAVEASHGESDFRLSTAAYDHPESCYDREYLFQFAEVDPSIHKRALAEVTALNGCTPGAAGCNLSVSTEPYHPAYFLINGRSMPDDMDDNYAPQYPHQPYNGDPHMHPGEMVLLRIIGQGHWQHPFHEHANHVRILARDGNLILTPDGGGLAGPPLFTTTTTPGLAMDGLFYFTGRGLNWDMYGHNAADPVSAAGATPSQNPPCVADVNGYYTVLSSPPAPANAINYFEWCADHDKPLEVAPVGDVGAGGPATLPDPHIFTNGAWYSGSPYLGPDATTRATGPNSNFLPSNAQANPASERGFAFMWHSHNEREITTNNVFPGGMLMMMLVDSREFPIDEAK